MSACSSLSLAPRRSRRAGWCMALVLFCLLPLGCNSVRFAPEGTHERALSPPEPGTVDLAVTEDTLRAWGTIDIGYRVDLNGIVNWTGFRMGLGVGVAW